MSLIDQQIIEQEKVKKLERIKTDIVLIQNEVLTPAYLEKLRIDKWDGKNSTYYSGGDNIPFMVSSSKK